MSNFSSRILQIKTERRLLQKDIAANIGLSLRAYQYYEKGQKEPTLSVLIALADYFEVSLDYLVGRTDCPDILTYDKEGNIIILEAMKPSKGE